LFRSTKEDPMATTTRTDRHRPSAPEFDPADYEFVAVHDNNADWPRANDHFLAMRRELLATGWTFSGVHGGMGQCDHCGARLRYSALMKHLPTRTLIYVGEQCLGNRFEMTKAEFDAARKAAQLDRERQAQLVAFNALCEDVPELVWATYAHNIGTAGTEYRTEPVYFDESDGPTVERAVAGTSWAERNRQDWAISTLSDIARKARRYGSFASEKQAQLVVRLVGELEAAEAATAEREAKRAAEQATRVNAAIGEIGERRDFTGTVRWFDHFESNFGYTPKTSTVMIIDTAEGTVKWTASSYISLERGQQITIKATVKEHTVYDRDQSITTVVTRGKIL
jgi:hypothetical protein